MTKYKFVTSVVVLMFSFVMCLQCIAVFIPDFLIIGSNPEILSVEPSYLIPGEVVRIKGKNFFEFPKKANKLFVNNRPVRILSSKSNYIEFVVPKISPKNGKIKLYTKYFGHKSDEVNYPPETDKYIPITFHGPKLNSTDTYSVKPRDEILIYGNFRNSALLFFRVNNQDVEGTVISNNTCKLKLPKELPSGIFKIEAYYKKKSLQGDEYFQSVESNPLILYNIASGEPFALKLNLERNKFDSLNLSTAYKVLLYFSSGETVDVTEFSDVKLLDNEFFELNLSERRIKPKKRGYSILEGRFMWLPTEQEFFDSQVLSIETPRSPNFQEVIVNEVFPFASPYIKESDANMNGFAKGNEDEFIELKNLTGETIDLSNCVLLINEVNKPQFQFKDSSLISSNSFITIFGADANDGKLGLSESGGTIELACNGKTIDYAAYLRGKSGEPSWIRKDDLSGFEKHGLVLFSPNEENIKTKDDENLIPNVLSIDSQDNAQQGTQNDISRLQLKGLNVFPTTLQFTTKEPIQINVSALFDNGESKDVTQQATYMISGAKDIIKIDSISLITPLMNGIVTIEISYFEKLIELIASVNLTSPVKPKQLIINEILAAPNIDVNKDSIFKSDQDEFVELVNVSGDALDISGLIISDNQKVRHVIVDGTVLEYLEPIVIFGGGTLNNFSQSIKTQLASTGSLGLNNNGLEKVVVSTIDGKIIDELSFDNANLQGISLNRLTELSFESNLTQHDKLVTNKFSPGTRIDGTLFVQIPPIVFSNSSSSSSGAISSSSSSSSSSSGSIVSSSSSSGSSSSGCLIESFMLKFS